MASVVTTFFSTKRRGRTPALKPKADPLLKKDDVVLPSSGGLSENTIRRIQSWYRGARARTMFRRIKSISSELSPDAVSKVLSRIIRVHRGWERFLLTLLALFMFLAMCVIQISAPDPGGSDVNQSVMDVVDSAGFVPYEQVTRAQQVWDYVDVIRTVFAAAMNPDDVSPVANLSPEDAEIFKTCAETSAQLCYRNFTSLLVEAADVLNLTTCMTRFFRMSDGYVDNQNRIQIGMYVAQQRYQSKPCYSNVVAKNPLRKLPAHACLSQSAPPATFYESEICGNLSNPNLVANCFDVSDFILNPVLGAFVSTIPTGDIDTLFGLSLTECKIQNMKQLGWLDYRTQKSCIYFFTFNSNEQGRMAAFRECFSFPLGGKVAYTRDVASSSFPPDHPTVIGVTVAFAVSLGLLMIWEFRALVKRRINWVMDTFLVSLFILCIADLTVFFVLYVQSENFQLDVSGDLTVFANPDEFWNDMETFFATLVVWQKYYTMLASTMFLFILQTLFVLDFHPTLGIVSGTLKFALSELSSFLLVYAIVLIAYTSLGMVFFSQNFEVFSTFGDALVMMIYTSLSQIDAVGEIVLNPNVRVGRFAPTSWIEILWYYSFLIIVTILLFNVLLSIIVGSFVQLQEKRQKKIQYFDLFTMLRISILIWERRFRCGLLWLWSKLGRCRRHKKQPTRAETMSEFSSKHAPMNKYNVIASLESLMVKYRTRSGSAIVLREELGVLFSNESIRERIISQMREYSLRERHHNDVVALRAMRFQNEDYQAHIFSTLHRLMTQFEKSNASISRTRFDSDPIEKT